MSINAVQFRQLHIGLVLALVLVCIPANYVYFKHRKTFGPYVGAAQQIRLLIRQGNSDGWLAAISSVLGVLIGIGLIVLNFYR